MFPILFLICFLIWFDNFIYIFGTYINLFPICPNPGKERREKEDRLDTSIYIPTLYISTYRHHQNNSHSSCFRNIHDCSTALLFMVEITFHISANQCISMLVSRSLKASRVVADLRFDGGDDHDITPLYIKLFLHSSRLTLGWYKALSIAPLVILPCMSET